MSDATALVVMPKLALVAHPGTDTLAGTPAAASSLLTARVTPPASAGPSSVTVAVAIAPPVTDS